MQAINKRHKEKDNLLLENNLHFLTKVNEAIRDENKEAL